MIESRSVARRRRRKGVPNKTVSAPDSNTYNVDNTMILLIGVDHCDTKQIITLCDNEIGFTETVTIHPVENVDMSNEYVQQYKDNGFIFCAVVVFRFYKPNLKNYQLQQLLLQKGITTIVLDNKQYIVTHKLNLLCY